MAAALAAGRRECFALYLAEGTGGVGDLTRAAEARGVPVRRCARATIEKHLARAGAAGVAHQGVLLEAGPLPRPSVTELAAAAFASGRPPLFAALDGVEDPRHLGAVVRTAEALGAAGLLYTVPRSAPLSPAALKAAAGAAEYLPLVPVSDLGEALGALSDCGVEVVAADAASGESLADSGLVPPLCIVVGNESRGLSRAVRARADRTVRIPLSGRTESLSVSAAAAILLWEASRRSKMKA